MYFEIYDSEPSTGLLGTRPLAGGIGQLSPSSQRWRWRLRSDNHKILASGEGYTHKVDCETAVELLKSTDAKTPIRYL